MPEASVDEHSQPLARKYEIRPRASPTATDVHRAINSVTESAPMEFRPERPLRPGVHTAVRSHREGCVLRGRRCSVSFGLEPIARAGYSIPASTHQGLDQAR